MACMVRRENGFRVPGLARSHRGPRSPSLLEEVCVDIDSNLVENAIRSLAIHRRNARLAGHDEGDRNWARITSLIAACKINGVEPNACLRDLFIRLANGHLDKDPDALMRWAYIAAFRPSR
jgi:transposase